MSRSTVKLLYIADLVAMLILFFVCRYNLVALYSVAGVAIAFALFLSYKLRCPHCGAWPRKGSLFHEFCPKCGKRLEDE